MEPSYYIVPVPERGTGRDVESEVPVVEEAPKAVTPKLGECHQQVPETRSDRTLQLEGRSARYCTESRNTHREESTHL